LANEPQGAVERVLKLMQAQQGMWRCLDNVSLTREKLSFNWLVIATQQLRLNSK
jgi:hypothetical protein